MIDCVAAGMVNAVYISRTRHMWRAEQICSDRVMPTLDAACASVRHSAGDGRQGAMKEGRSRAVRFSRHFDPDWLAGHVGFEPANPCAIYVTGNARQLRPRWAQPGGGDPSAF